MNLYLGLLFWIAGLSNKASERGGVNNSKEGSTLRLPSQETFQKFVSRKSPRLRKSSRRNRNSRLNGRMKAGIKRLKAEMVEIGEEQKCIKEGHRQVRKKCEEIAAQHKLLWKETEWIAKQSASIRLKLHLISKLVKAKAQNDTASVAQLTHSLRGLVAKQNEQIQ